MRSTALTLAVGALFALPAAGSDLQLAGQQNTVALLGTSVPVTLTGGAGLPAVIYVDVSPGPISFAGESVALGFTPSALVLAGGVTNGAGVFASSLAVPVLPSLLGVTFYSVGVVLDPTDPNGLDFSNGASLGFTDVAVNPIEVELAGVPLASGPRFAWVTSLRESDPVRVAIDPALQPQLVGTNVDIYITAARTAAEWIATPSLVDVSSGGAETVAIGAGGVVANTFVADTGTLSGDAGASLGVAYDVVIDANQNGVLDSGDLIDGFSTGAGFYICRDPSVAGPFAVSSATYSGGSFLGQIVYYPTNIAALSNVPLVIVSHGNGHNYLWYGHIGQHLASYGYVVMSHQNNTVPGVVAASTTTLTNTDFLLSNLDTIAGGALLGKIDIARMTWIGHSRGGEGIAIAYDRILKGLYTPVNYTLSNLRLLSSMAPTDFQGPGQTNTHGVNYHLWVAESDADVNGCTSSDVAQPYHLFARATNQRQATTIYGAGHGDLHNGTGSSVAAGPCLLGRPVTHGIMRGYLLPLVEFHIRDNPAAKDWLARQYEDLAPQSAPVGINPCIVVNLQFREAASTGKLVIDTFEGGATSSVASSGAPITTNLANYTVGRLDDPDTVFTGNATQPFNGMTYARNTDFEGGGVFTFDNADAFLRYNLLPGQRDWSGLAALSLRACQSTRSTLTTGELGDASFTVRVTDTNGNGSSIRLADVLQGFEEPYQRTSCGVGVGWSNQFETLRIGLRQFQALTPSLDLSSIASVELRFGPSHGSPFGFFGIDDLEVVAD